MKKMENLRNFLTINNSTSNEVAGKLSEILKSFYNTMSKDTMIGFFFQNKDLNKITEAQTDLLMMVLGFTDKYKGVPVNQAHIKLPPILEGHFNRRIVLLEKTLEEFALTDKAKEEWVSFEKSFRNVIVK